MDSYYECTNLRNGCVILAYMTRYSEGMKAAWSKKTPSERTERMRRLALHRWRLLKRNKHFMDKVTVTIGGVDTDFFPQSYTDAAVATAVAAVPASGEVVKDVVIENEDGTSEKLDPEVAA